MEEKRVNVTNKQGKKKTNNPLSSLISVGGEGGGGIAGLVVFGGALAVAGYVAVASFARNKNKAKGKGKGTTNHEYDHPQPNKPQEELLLLDECLCKSEEDHHHHEITPQKLHSLLQRSTTPQDVDAACNCASNMNRSINQVSPSDLFSAQPLTQEEEKDEHNHKPKTEGESPTCFHHQEIAFSDYSHPGSATSSNENAAAEDCLASLFNSLGGQEQEEDEVENYEPEDIGLKSTESESESESEEDDMDEDSDGALGSGEDDDSSKATGSTTGSTSLDYNDESVWRPEFRGSYFDNHGCRDSDADGSEYAGNEEAMAVTNEATLSEKASLCVVQNDKPYSVLKTWVIPTLLLAVLLILALLTRQESFYVLDEGTSVY